MRSLSTFLNLSLLIVILSACAPAPQGNALRDDAPATSPAPQTNSLPQDTTESFKKGIEQAKSAETLAKWAKSGKEWNIVAGQWTDAIALLKTVPKTDANYSLAQQKIAEYQKNLETAQKQAKTAK
jgi:hypothetical protein